MQIVTLDAISRTFVCLACQLRSRVLGEGKKMCWIGFRLGDSHDSLTPSWILVVGTIIVVKVWKALNSCLHLWRILDLSALLDSVRSCMYTEVASTC